MYIFVDFVLLDVPVGLLFVIISRNVCPLLKSTMLCDVLEAVPVLVMALSAFNFCYFNHWFQPALR